jgi:hypothetical protein
MKQDTICNWDTLIFIKPLYQAEIKECVKDSEWQKFRASLKGMSTEQKYQNLVYWIYTHLCSRAAQIQVTNYVNALKRGGIVTCHVKTKPSLSNN